MLRLRPKMLRPLLRLQPQKTLGFIDIVTTLRPVGGITPPRNLNRARNLNRPRPHPLPRPFTLLEVVATLPEMLRLLLRLRHQKFLGFTGIVAM